MWVSSMTRRTIFLTSTRRGAVTRRAIVAMFSPDLTAYNTIPLPVAFAPQGSVATSLAGGAFPNTTRQSNEVRLVITPAATRLTTRPAIGCSCRLAICLPDRRPVVVAAGLGETVTGRPGLRPARS